MKRRSDSLVLGLAIFIGCFMALLVATSVIRKTRAQAPEQNNPAVTEAPMPMENLPAPDAATELPPPPTEDTAATPAAPAPLDASQDPGMRPMNPEGYIYDPTGRRDPFFPPMTLSPIITPGQQVAPMQERPSEGPEGVQNVETNDPLLSYNLRDYRLVGILWEVSNPRAMVRTPTNQVLTLRLKMRLGRENALVAAIRESEVVVMEPDGKGEYKKGQIHRIRMKN